MSDGSRAKFDSSVSLCDLRGFEGQAQLASLASSSVGLLSRWWESGREFGGLIYREKHVSMAGEEDYPNAHQIDLESLPRQGGAIWNHRDPLATRTRARPTPG